ncbi:hypothetical protein [Microcystis phage MaeS]|nr:hypothetical protein [Microcystis phage MaeS]
MKVEIIKGTGWNKGMEGKQFRVIPEEIFYEQTDLLFPSVGILIPVEHPDNNRKQMKTILKRHCKVVEEDGLVMELEKAQGIIQHIKGRFVQVNRKAKKGDQIYIVNPTFSRDMYKTGDILTVDRAKLDGTVFVDAVIVAGNWQGQIDTDEFVVVEPYTDEEITTGVFDTLKKVANIAGVSAKDLMEAINFVNKVKDTPKVEPQKSNNPEAKHLKSDRDHVVEFAQHYVKDILGLLTEPTPYYGYRFARNKYYNHNQGVEVEFIVTDDKTVICLLKNKVTKKVFKRGKAKVAKGDCFNVHIGQAIALTRAVKGEVPSEFINTPAPEGFEVGDIIKSDNNGLCSWKITEITPKIDKTTDFICEVSHVNDNNWIHLIGKEVKRNWFKDVYVVDDSVRYMP